MNAIVFSKITEADTTRVARCDETESHEAHQDGELYCQGYF